MGEWIDQTEKTLIKKYISGFRSNTILEIGSGTGHWTDFFCEHGFFVLGLDIAPEMISIAKNKNIPKSVFMQGDVLNLPYNDKSVDNIVAITSLEFVENQMKALDEIYRVLRSDGSLLIGALNKNGSLNKKKNNHEWLQKADCFTPESLCDFLSVFGKPEIEGAVILPHGYNNDLEENIKAENSADYATKIESGNFLAGYVKKINI